MRAAAGLRVSVRSGGRAVVSAGSGPRPTAGEPLTPADVWARLDALRAKADEFFGRVAAARPEAITCRRGCAGCCRVDLTVFAVEADALRAAVAALPEAARRGASLRARAGQHCALLDPEDGRCLVYAERPLICRTHGLAVRFEGRTSWCPLNYRDETPALADTLVLERLNAPLSLLDHLARPGGGAAGRVRIAEIVLGSDSG